MHLCKIVSANMRQEIGKGVSTLIAADRWCDRIRE